jgi:HTH-type transcriptional regulator/antitoxin HigA
MVARDVELAINAWPSVAPIVFVPRSEQQYVRLVEVLDALVDAIGEDEEHPLASLMEVVGTLVESYEDLHVPELSG